MARDADSRAWGAAELQHEARREFVSIKERHDAAMGTAGALFVELAAAAPDLGWEPSEIERRFWTAIEDAIAVAARLYDSAATWGLGWVSPAEQGDISRILHSAGEELPARHHALITERLTRLWDAWPAASLVGLGPHPRPAVAGLNLKNVAQLALSLLKARLVPAQGGTQNIFDLLAACLSEHMGLPSFVLPEARVTGQRPILVSSLIDPRLAAAWVIKESSAELVPPALGLETLPATLQALCLSQQGLFADAGLMDLVFSEDVAVVGLHHEWKKLTRALPDARARARCAEDLARTSPAAQAQFGVYILSGEIEGTLERILPPAARSEERDLWWWTCRFAGHYAAGAGAKADRLIHAEARIAAEIRKLSGRARIS
jgi:hypothetical protein